MVYLHTREVASRGKEWNFWSSPVTRQELVLRQCWSLSDLWGGKDIGYLSAATLRLKFENDPMSLPCKVDSKGEHSNRLNHAPSRDHKLISNEVTATTTKKSFPFLIGSMSPERIGVEAANLLFDTTKHASHLCNHSKVEKRSPWKLLLLLLSHFIHWLRKWGHRAIWTWYRTMLQELKLSHSE